MKKSPIRELVKQLEKDGAYRYGWIANIAMAYKDNYRWYKEKTGKKTMNKMDLHIIANNAAVYFLKELCRPPRTPKRRCTLHR